MRISLSHSPFEVMRASDTVLGVRKLAGKAGERPRFTIVLNMSVIKYFAHDAGGILIGILELYLFAGINVDELE